MANTRLELQARLLVVMGGAGSHVYFQPPSSVNLEYPCIVYKKARMDTQFADNTPYKLVKKYQITIIDRSPDSEYFDALAQLGAVHATSFTKDNLNHDIFNLFY